MINYDFRPWGLLPWVTSKLQNVSWNVIGCLSSEERCKGVVLSCDEAQLTVDYKFIEVTNPKSIYDVEAKKLRNNFRSELMNNHSVNSEDFISMQLMESPQLLLPWCKRYIENSSENIILDISTFPKRFFFPIIKQLTLSSHIKNLLVTYTVPKKYPEATLAINASALSQLPTFINPTPPYDEEVGILGVGFLPHDLPDLLKNSFPNMKPRNFHLLFPFPPGSPNYQKNWEFVREIEQSGKIENSNQIVRVATLDVSGCFQHISKMSQGYEKKTFFLPFGPKTQSLAICLFATLNDCTVYYAQPESYHKDYSIGINSKNGQTETYAYCIKLNGTNLFTS